MTLAYVGLGFIWWTLNEYLLHRFFLHAEERWMKYVPMSGWLYLFHFTVHGAHHAFPSDRYRIETPPLLALLIMRIGVIPPLSSALAPPAYYPFMIGFLLGYVSYDLTHYYLHHGDNLVGYLRDLKIYHMQHHYKYGEIGFGVTNKVWDIVFGTKIPDKLVYMPKVKGD